MNLSDTDIEELRYAKHLLENPGLAARIMNTIGTPIEAGLKMLPSGWANAVVNATRVTLEKALIVALQTLDTSTRPIMPQNFFHKCLLVATGAAGGSLGLAGLAVELPVSTCVMLRSIADIARSHGEQLQTRDAQFACIQVFALGGRSDKDDANDSAYFMIRAGLAKSVTEALEYAASRSTIEEGAPVLLRFIMQVAERFQINVTEKVAFEAIPLVGAAGGACVNLMFIDHFQSMAQGHFIVRRLERTYSPDLVREVYRRI